MSSFKRFKKKDKDVEGIFIPAGLFIGFGFGFLFNNIPAGTLLGFGFGLLLFGIANMIRKK